jgi:hypothetical protein
MFPLQELFIEVLFVSTESVNVSYKIASFFFLSCFSVYVFISIPYVTIWVHGGYVIATSFGYKGLDLRINFLMALF